MTHREFSHIGLLTLDIDRRASSTMESDAPVEKFLRMPGTPLRLQYVAANLLRPGGQTSCREEYTHPRS